MEHVRNGEARRVDPGDDRPGRLVARRGAGGRAVSSSRGGRYGNANSHRSLGRRRLDRAHHGRGIRAAERVARRRRVARRGRGGRDGVRLAWPWRLRLDSGRGAGSGPHIARRRGGQFADGGPIRLFESHSRWRGRNRSAARRRRHALRFAGDRRRRQRAHPPGRRRAARHHRRRGGSGVHASRAASVWRARTAPSPSRARCRTTSRMDFARPTTTIAISRRSGAPTRISFRAAR